MLKYYIPEFWPTNLIMSSNISELWHIIDLHTAPIISCFFGVVLSEFKFPLEDCFHQNKPCDSD